MTEAATGSGVTFVATGAIGLPMALQLRTAGFDVTCVEPGPAQYEKATASGLRCVPQLTDAPANPLVLVMVATPTQLAQVVDAATAEERGRLTRAGATVVDAPVTGGVRGAEAAALRIFCAGEADAVERAQPALSAMGTVEIVGAQPGRGQAVKIVNQHLCSVHLAAAAESLALARDLGLDPTEVLDLVGQGAAASWMLTDRGPRMLQESPEITSSVGIFVKDSSLVAEAAAAAGSATPLLDAARDRFLQASGMGLDHADDSSVYRTY